MGGEEGWFMGSFAAAPDVPDRGRRHDEAKIWMLVDQRYCAIVADFRLVIAIDDIDQFDSCVFRGLQGLFQRGDPGVLISSVR